MVLRNDPSSLWRAAAALQQQGRFGEAAVAFVQRQEGYADAPRPDLIFLDLNLPRLDGREVLALIKSTSVEIMGQ